MLQADLYSASHALQARDAAAIMADYPELLAGRPRDLVLDVGCGPGCVTAEVLLPALLPSGVGHLVGVDICPDMVAHARRAYSHHKIQFEQLDITEDVTPQTRTRLLHGDKEGFHKVFSFYCLHWVQEQRRALGNIMHLMRPGGKALLVFLANCPIFTMYEVLSNKSLWRPYMQDVSRYVSPYQYNPQPATTLQKLLKDIGFWVARCECRPSSFEYSSIEELTDSINAVNPFLSRIPEELKETFIRDCVSESMKLISHKSSSTNSHRAANLVKYHLLIAYVQKKNDQL